MSHMSERHALLNVGLDDIAHGIKPWITSHMMKLAVIVQAGDDLSVVAVADVFCWDL